LGEKCSRREIKCVGQAFYKLTPVCTAINIGMNTGGVFTPDEDRDNEYQSSPPNDVPNPLGDAFDGVASGLDGINSAAIRLGNALAVKYFNSHCRL
jgi:hypothetical protein